MSDVGQIVGIGGGVLLPDSGNLALERYVLDASGASKPRVLFVPTASGEDPTYVARFEETYRRLGCERDVLRFFRRTPEDLDAVLASFDVVHVGGGNTRSMLAVWRHWDFDVALRRAWQNGAVLCGSSAGSICWFENGLTDSVAGDFTAMACLGFLAGSNCPHYDGEADRRPWYRRLVGSGALPPGIACDDGVGLHFRGETLAAVVSSRESARAYRVYRENGAALETPLEATVVK